MWYITLSLPCILFALISARDDYNVSDVGKVVRTKLNAVLAVKVVQCCFNPYIAAIKETGNFVVLVT